MFITTDILITWGAVSKKVKKGEFIFNDGEHASFYYQVVKGTIRMFNTNEDGKEFTNGEFIEGQSFGEPPLFIDEPYPASAVATEDSVVMRLAKDKFLKILEEYPALQRKFITMLSQRLYEKSITTRDIINTNPEIRILSFLRTYKKRVHKENELIEIPYTRQEIANFTGLRVETVIRTLMKLKQDNSVQIVKHKLIC